MNSLLVRRVLVLVAVCTVTASMLVSQATTGIEPGTAGAGGPAVAHRSGARIADAGAVPIPSPRIFSTGTESMEPTFGFGPDGAMYVHGNLAADVRRSIDGGITWTNVSPNVVNLSAPKAALSLEQELGDPYLFVDERTGRIFASDVVVPCQQTSFSDDGGLTWTTSVGSCNQADHQTLFTGPPTVSTPEGYPNVVYDCAINGGVLAQSSTATSCNKSLDGGLTFTPTVTMPYTTADAPRDAIGTLGIPGMCDGATGHGFVGPDGTVYLPRGWCGQPWLAISSDEGATWTRVLVAANGMQRSNNGSPSHETSVVADADGNVYYLWVAEDRLPYLAISRDRGAHFDTPMMIAPPGLDEAGLPGMAIGASGKIAITYMGTPSSPGPPYPSAATCRPLAGCGLNDGKYSPVKWNNYVTMTVDALASDPLFFTASMNDPADPLMKGTCGIPVRCGAEFDFIDVQIAPDGTPWSIFIDGCPRTGTCTATGMQYVGHLVGGPSLR